MEVVFQLARPPRFRPFNQSFEHFSKAAPQIRIEYNQTRRSAVLLLQLLVLRGICELFRVALPEEHTGTASAAACLLHVLLHVNHLKQMRLCEIRKLFHYIPNHSYARASTATSRKHRERVVGSWSSKEDPSRNVYHISIWQLRGGEQKKRNLVPWN